MTEQIAFHKYSNDDIESLLVLTNKIFHANLAQQNALFQQRMVAQIELVSLAKCVQLLLEADTTNPETIETLTARILGIFDQLQSKAVERLSASQKQINELLEEVRSRVETV